MKKFIVLLISLFCFLIPPHANSDVTGDIYFTESAGNPTGEQNYLVCKSVHEPTQMILFGTALIGLAGVGRKRFIKK